MKSYEIDRDELKNIGINRLTGEACAMGMRILCELTYSAMVRYLDYTGIQADISAIPKSNWNDAKRWSVFLTRQAMHDLLVMALLEENEAVIEVKSGAYNYLYTGDLQEMRAYFLKNGSLYNCLKPDGTMTGGNMYNIGRTYTFGSNPHRGFSNIHAMTGYSQ